MTDVDHRVIRAQSSSAWSSEDSGRPSTGLLCPVLHNAARRGLGDPSPTAQDGEASNSNRLRGGEGKLELICVVGGTGHHLNSPSEPAVRVLDLLKNHILEDLHSALPCASL